jgi:phosphoglycolate phosphatase-like HAD superfamily hydrolase
MFRAVALDFDGVISDSAPEAFVVALRTWAEMHPDSSLCPAAAKLSGQAAPAPDAVQNHELYAGFLEHMPLGNRAEDYAVVLTALASELALPDQAAYDALRDGLDPKFLRSFHKRFYQVRGALGRSDPAGWQRLMRPYPAFVELLRRRASDVTLAIATAKDRHSVAILLRLYGIDDLFADGFVLDKETGSNKASHMEHLRRALGFEYPEMAFVDDKVNHLDTVSVLGVSCCLAAWGYNGSREVALARQRGHRVCSLDDVEAQLFA